MVSLFSKRWTNTQYMTLANNCFRSRHGVLFWKYARVGVGGKYQILAEWDRESYSRGVGPGPET